MRSTMVEKLSNDTQSGFVTASLAAPSEPYDLAFLVARINENIKPPAPLAEGDIFIRAMYVVSDSVNAYGGRFPADEHPCLADLMVDAPVLVGHRKDHLPVGRNFHAVVEQKEEQSWVKSYFYWLRSAEGALSLRDNIDGGIYKECSIGFMYGLAECSVCGSDMRACGHQTTQDGSVWFNYRQIQRVLETSLVYRGATPDTFISRQLRAGKRDGQVSRPQLREWNPKPVANWRALDEAVEYVVVPAYAGIPVVAHFGESLLEVRDLDEKTLLSLPLNRKTPSNQLSVEPLDGLLVGMRGRDRCTALETDLYLKKGRGPVSRLELRLFPGDQMESDLLPARCGELTVRKMRTERTGIASLPTASRNLQTREGVYLWQAGSRPFSGHAQLLTPAGIRDTRGASTSIHTQPEDAALELYDGRSRRRFAVPTSCLPLLASGKKLVVEEIVNRPRQDALQRPSGSGFTSLLTGARVGVHVRPVRIHGVLKYLIYHSPAEAQMGSFTKTELKT